jgi:eukaryotic-like serine/threonine-protein kinase
MLVAGTWVEGWLVQAGPVAKGAMATVMPARHADGRRAALKVLHRELCTDSTALARFEVERQVLRSVHHPGVVGLFGAGDLSTGQSWLALEWLDSEPLKRRLARGPLGRDEVSLLAMHLGEALEAVHAAGWAHRDVTSANIFWRLGEVRPARLIDFSAARALGTGGVDLGLTSTGHVIGTSLSPEQLRGEAVTPATDVYALGVVLYEAVAGRPPFFANSFSELEHLHLRAAPPSLVGGGALEAALRRCLAKRPNDRYPSARAAARAVAEALSTSAVQRVVVTTRALSEAGVLLADNLRGVARRRLVERGCVLEAEGPTTLALLPPGDNEGWVEGLRRELDAAAARVPGGALEISVEVYA